MASFISNQLGALAIAASCLALAVICPGQSQTFVHTGSLQSFVVPPAVTEMHIVASGCHQQAWCHVPGANLLGIVTSNDLTLVVGS